MRRFTWSQGSSRKFWNIECEGKSLIVTSGRMGTKGRTLTKAFTTPAAAHKEHDRLVQEKLNEGYTEILPAAGQSDLRAALEKALVDNPDDVGTHMAYADFLQEHDDPRGEFIQVQLALEDEGRSANERKKLRRREQQLLRAHQKEWLGPLADYLLSGCAVQGEGHKDNCGRYDCCFARGWLDTLAVGELSVEFAIVLAQAGQLRLLRRLEIALSYLYDVEPDRNVRRKYCMPDRSFNLELYPLLSSSYLGNVRVLHIGKQVDERLIDSGRGRDGRYRVHYHCGNFCCYQPGDVAADLVAKMPKLEELYLFADHVDTDKLFRLPRLTHLRVLQLYHSYHYPLELLAANPALGRLTHLLLHPKAAGAWSEDTPYIKRGGVQAILHSSHLRSLTHLRLRLTDLGDQGCEEIVRSGILKRLKLLDLRHGCITDEGARILAACPEIGNLELLDLTRNNLTRAGIRILRTTVCRLLADYQYTEQEMEEAAYLQDGDIE